MKKICDVYKSVQVQGMYLYVEKLEGLERVPELLMNKFGAPKHVMTMLIKPEQQLSIVSGEKLLLEIIERGFYLQMPPQPTDEQRDIAVKNTKLSSGKY
ncbi:MAG: YcgL domain-containing protein [Sinobacterium sp.]|nr:YcgL domain-containing protein [Sinobacterium sp.]